MKKNLKRYSNHLDHFLLFQKALWYPMSVTQTLLLSCQSNIQIFLHWVYISNLSMFTKS